ncbi:MAG: hypothetical protein LCI02_04815 [Proteobacteria bacterium]|nr:hypothetical protein [Pseudomonadota bacterium]
MEYVQIAIYIIALIVAVAARRKSGAAPKAAALEDLEFPQSTEGTAQMIIFGDVWVRDWMVLGVGNFRAEPILK